MGRRKFTNEQVLDICNRYAIGEKSQSGLALEYNVTVSAVRDILVFFTYSKVTAQLDDDIKKAISERLSSYVVGSGLAEYQRNNRSFSKEHIERLFRGVLQREKSVSQVAEQIGMKRSTATAILKGKLYADSKPDLTAEEEYILEDLREFRYEVNGHLTEEQVRTIYKEFVETDITKSQLANKYGVNDVVIRHLLTGQSYKHIYYSLSSEETRKIDGAINRKRGVKSTVTKKKRESAEQGYSILKRILTTTTSYSKIAEEVGVHPSYITLLLKKKRGKFAWDMLNSKETELIKEIREDPSYRKEAVKIYSEMAKTK